MSRLGRGIFVPNALGGNGVESGIEILWGKQSLREPPFCTNVLEGMWELFAFLGLRRLHGWIDE